MLFARYYNYLYGRFPDPLKIAYLRREFKTLPLF